MKKSIFLFFAAILCSVSAWGANNLAKDSRIYFEKPDEWNKSVTQFMIGHNSYSEGYKMSAIANTNLYYKKWRSGMDTHK